MKDWKELYNKEEYDKCEKDPLYFHNNYVLSEGQTPITQEEYNLLIKSRDAIMLKGRRGNDIALYPITPNKAIKPEFDNLKKHWDGLEPHYI